MTSPSDPLAWTATGAGDCKGDPRRVGEIPLALFDFDLGRWFDYGWFDNVDCDGIANRLSFDAEQHYLGGFDLDSARHWRPEQDCDGADCGEKSW